MLRVNLIRQGEILIREWWTHLQMLSEVAATVKEVNWSIIKYRVQYKDN